MTTTPSLWRSTFQDNLTSPFAQLDGVVAPTSDNQFFAVWADEGNFGNNSAIIARKFDSLGNPLTGDVNLTAPFILAVAAEAAAVGLPIAGQSDGLAVAFTWSPPGNRDIFLVRTNATLVPLELFVTIENSFTLADHPSITSFSDGSLWVAYTIHNSATDLDILARRVEANGTVSAPITLFNDTDRSDNSDLATLANGNVVAVFQSEFNGSATDHDIIFTIKTPTGANVVSPTPVVGAADHPVDEFIPGNVAALADGGFVVSWSDPSGDSSGSGIRASVYDADGNLVNGNILVNVFNQTGNQGFDDVTALPDGGFIVAWNDFAAEVERAQRFDEAGNLVGTPFTFLDHTSLPDIG